MIAEFTISGPPKGKDRPKAALRGKRITVYTPKATSDYEALIRAEYRKQCGSIYWSGDNPVSVTIFAGYPIPKATSKKKRIMMDNLEIRPTVKPDADNVAKIILDGLNKVAYDDDKQVIALRVHKYYSDEPEVTVKIMDAETQEVRRHLQ